MLFTASHMRSRQRTVEGPALFQESIIQDVSRQTALTRPVSQRLRFPVPRNQAIVSAVVVLNQPNRPAAIARCIRAVVISAVKRVAFRTWSHLGEKTHEIVAPVRRHRNSTASVFEVGRIRWVVTPLFRLRPALVLDGFGTAVSRQSLPRQFALQASAALRFAGYQVVASDRFCRPAIAMTQPVRGTDATVRCSMDHRKSTEASSRQFNQRHTFHYMTEACLLAA